MRSTCVDTKKRKTTKNTIAAKTSRKRRERAGKNVRIRLQTRSKCLECVCGSISKNGKRHHANDALEEEQVEKGEDQEERAVAEREWSRFRNVKVPKVLIPMSIENQIWHQTNSTDNWFWVIDLTTGNPGLSKVFNQFWTAWSNQVIWRWSM